MLDPARRLLLRDFPNAQVYRDHEDLQTYYVIPTMPSLEIEDDGRAAFRLLIYVKREEGRKVPTGGQLTLTTSLELPPQELDAVHRAIEQQLKAQAPPREIDPLEPPTVRLVHPEWVSGAVHVQAAPSVVLTGQPSLFAGNRCVLMRSLDADQSSAVREALEHDFPDARITYEMVMSVAATAAGGQAFSTRQTRRAPGGFSNITREGTIDITAAVATKMPFTIEGRLWNDALELRATEIDLS